MHYKDGTEAKLGDFVKGTGYNVKNPDKTPRIIVGKVVGLTPGSHSCNIQVAHILTASLAKDQFPPFQLYAEKGVRSQDNTFGAFLDREYGQCDEFELVHREP